MARVGSSRRMGSFRSISQKARRQTSWTAGPGTTVQRTASGTVLFGTGLVPLVEGLTITRMRGELLLFLSAATTALDGYIGAIGIQLVSDEAFAAGVASMPTPIDDIDYEEWIWYQTFSIKAAGAMVGGASTDLDHPNALSAVARFTIDSRVQRKFPVGKTLVAVLEATETGGATLNVDLILRTLVTLP